MKVNKLFIYVFLASLITGCSSLGGYGTDNTPKPTPLQDFKAELNLQRNWSTSTGSGNGESYLRLSPALDNGKIFTADAKGRITALDSKTGRKIWRNDLKTGVTSGVSAGSGLVFIGTADGKVWALRESDGEIAWRGVVSNQLLSRVQITNNIALAKTIDGRLCAFRIENGQLLWVYDHGAPTLILRGGSIPQVSSNWVVAGYADGKLSAYTLDGGKLLWERAIATLAGLAEVERMIDIDADPQIANGIVYVATYQGNLAAVELQSGRLLWQRSISSYTGFVLDNQQGLYLTDAQGVLWAFNRTNGQLKWKQTALKDRVLTAPTLFANTIAVADGEGYLHLLARDDGHFVARILVDKSGINAAPVSAGNTLYVAANNGDLSMLQPIIR